MRYEDEMNAGHSCMARQDWSSAYRHFQNAHDLGHTVRSRHLAAHRAALEAARQDGRPGRILYQRFFLGVATFTSWNIRPPKARRAS
jgi:hypothetical protein